MQLHGREEQDNCLDLPHNVFSFVPEYPHIGPVCHVFVGPPYFPERNGTERNVPDRKHHLIPRNGPKVKVQLGLQLHELRSHYFLQGDRQKQ